MTKSMEKVAVAFAIEQLVLAASSQPYKIQNLGSKVLDGAN